jgi:hypothetical protein
MVHAIVAGSSTDVSAVVMIEFHDHKPFKIPDTYQPKKPPVMFSVDHLQATSESGHLALSAGWRLRCPFTLHGSALHTIERPITPLSMRPCMAAICGPSPHPNPLLTPNILLFPQSGTTFQCYPRRHRRYGPPIRIGSHSRAFRGCPAALRKNDQHRISQTPTRRATPELPLRRVHDHFSSGQSAGDWRFSRK